MSEVCETYHPVTRPPPNPNIRSRKTSRDHMQNHPSSLSQVKRNSKHSRIVNKHEKKIIFGNGLNVEKPAVERSLSWNNVKNDSLGDGQRSLSASNLYALSDPNLSLKQAVSKKAYDKPHTSYSKEKAIFTAWTQKYFHQLTIGCGNQDCLNRFCKSSKYFKIFNSSMAALMSIELSGYKQQHLCVKNEKKQEAKLFNQNIFKLELSPIKNGHSPPPVPFLYSFYSAAPFRSLFLPCPLTSSGLGLHRTHSHSEIKTSSNDSSSLTKTIANTLTTQLSVVTMTISASLSNIWNASTKEDQKTKQKGSEKKVRIQDDRCDECDAEVCSNVDEHEQIVTRLRIPSVRIFGDENAIDKDCDLYDDIDEFEKSVAEEFKGNSVLDDEEEGKINTDGYSLTHLTLDMFNTVINNYYECRDDSFLINTLRTVFSSWEALSMSFSDEGLKRTQQLPFDIKILDVENMFKALMKLEHSKVFMTELIDTVQVMLLSTHHNACVPSDLKPIVIILQIPCLFDHYQLVQELTVVINDLLTECKETLSLYLSGYSKEKFHKLVVGFKSLLTSETSWSVPCLKTNKNLVSLCKTLFVLYLANVFKGDQHFLVPNAEFYCPQLTEKIDFKQEYAYWKIMKSGEHSILNYPFLLEPAVKVQVMHIDAITQMREEYQDAIVHQARVQQVQKSWQDFNDSSSLSYEVRSAMCPYLLLEIRRDNFIEDTLKQLQEKSSDLKKPLKIKYTAGGEQGLDMGGLQKEFFQVIIETMFDPRYGLFTLSEDGHLVWFNAFSYESNVMFELIGILLGLAIYNGIILDVHFPLLVYKKLLGYSIGIDDLKEIQPTLCSGLEQLLQYNGDVENDFCLTFEASHSIFGHDIRVELLSNGYDIMVTNENRCHFVDLYVDSILNKSVLKQFEAFKAGFYQVYNGPTIKLFTPPELELLICGSPDLDFKALENVTEYKDGFTKTHPLMLELWEIVHQFIFKQKQALLMFVTGSYRVPLKGLGSMSFYIQRNGPDSNNLPTSMTCFNRLLLPEYRTGAKLKRMLLLAVENAKGFGLT